MGKRRKLFKRHTNSSVNLALAALGLILLVIILGKLFQVFSSLWKPFTADTLVKKEYSWDGKTAINLAIKGQEVEVASFDPIAHTLTVLKIPDDVYFDLPKGYGSWRVGAIYDLGQENNPPVGAELLKESLAKLVGLPIDGFVTYNNDSSFEDMVKSWHSDPFKILGFIKGSSTDLGFLEALGVYKSLSSLRPDQIISLDTSQTSITTSKLLPDSSRVLGVDTIQLDLFVRAHMADQALSQEDIPVAIYNSTNHPGLAEDVSRIVTNMGGNVVFVSNTTTDLQKTAVTSSGNSLTATRLKEVFAPECLNSKCDIVDPEVSSSFAQINIVIGEDYYSKYYSK